MESKKGRGGAPSWSSHQRFKNKAKNRVDDLQEIFIDLQFARRENRMGDVTVLEEQVHQLLREWKAELHEASPANSLLAASLSSSELSSDMKRLLQLHEEDDDASSHHKPQLDGNLIQPNNDTVYETDFLVDNLHTPEQTFERVRKCVNGRRICQNNYLDTPEQVQAKLEDASANYIEHSGQVESMENMEVMGNGFLPTSDQVHGNIQHLQASEHLHAGLDNIQESNFPQRSDNIPSDGNLKLEISDSLVMDQLDFNEDFIAGIQSTMTLESEDDTAHLFCGSQPTVSPPPSAFLGPKCALWDCPRPAQGIDWCHDYCCNFHYTLALKEGAPGMSPVLRPGGIDLKDGPLFAALTAKSQDKAVGIPQCEGAATTKSPWNAHELFDICVLEGESIREWLFFDKPRRAFESGNRKQRSLPDYNGRGWHESRKQVMKDFGGLKRSYYMDPQPSTRFEWHLYEYEINECDACALYRLELKAVSSKKNVKAKFGSDPMVDLQNQIGKLSAELSGETKRHNIGRAKAVKKNSNTNNIPVSTQGPQIFLPPGYYVEGSNGCFSTQ